MQCNYDMYKKAGASRFSPLSKKYSRAREVNLKIEVLLDKRMDVPWERAGIPWYAQSPPVVSDGSDSDKELRQPTFTCFSPAKSPPPPIGHGTY